MVDRARGRDTIQEYIDYIMSLVGMGRGGEEATRGFRSPRWGNQPTSLPGDRIGDHLSQVPGLPDQLGPTSGPFSDSIRDLAGRQSRIPDRLGPTGPPRFSPQDQAEIGGGGSRFSPLGQNEIGGGGGRPPIPPSSPPATSFGGGYDQAEIGAGPGTRPPWQGPPVAAHSPARGGTGRTEDARGFDGAAAGSPTTSRVTRDIYRDNPDIALMDRMIARGMDPRTQQGAASAMQRYGGPSGGQFRQMMLGSPNDPDLGVDADMLLNDLLQAGGGQRLVDQGQRFVDELRTPSDLRREQYLKMGASGLADLAGTASTYRGELPGIADARQSLIRRRMDDAQRQLRLGGQRMDLTPDEWLKIISDVMAMQG